MLKELRVANLRESYYKVKKQKFTTLMSADILYKNKI